MGPFLIAGIAMTVGWGLAQYKEKTGVFASKRKLDTNLTKFQKLEVQNALLYLTDPQALHVMAMKLQLSPIAGNAIETKSQTLAGGHPYTPPDFDYT